MELLRPIVHYGMHFIIPGAIAFVFFRKQWLKIWGVFLLTMLVDIDHLLATPVFEANRCSINFHPLHSYFAIGIYVLMLFPSKSRIVAIGLLFHMLTDALDCLWIK